jgi:hypothetical protein
VTRVTIIDPRVRRLMIDFAAGIYIGGGALVLILIIIVIVLMLRR